MKNCNFGKLLPITLIAIFIITLGGEVVGQGFGKNKPRYRKFDFKVLETPHFDLHYYMKNKSAVNYFGQMAEEWYDYHAQIVGDTIAEINPLILYNNHAEFQQTNSISGSIGVGTGGVTEAFKNRVVMPITYSNQQTRQVLGHELVHAFQFNTILNGDSTSLESLGNLPLWVVEGMAEYMSIGRVDPFTAMWMRDAIVNDNLPTLKRMANPRYFPYRYGQAAWSIFTGKYGDQVIAPFFKNTAIFGIEYASRLVFNMTLDDLSTVWQSSLLNHFDPYLRDKNERPQGKLLFSQENSGRINVSPSMSPNGRYVIFLSEKDLFSTDLFLADIRKGEIISKVSSLVKDSDLDNLNSMESSGTWSPNGRDFAFVAFKKGQNVLVIKDADKGKTLETIAIPGLKSISGPAWAPDGRSIVMTGMVEGQPDLYQYDIRSKRVQKLTDDIYSEIFPNFNNEGSKLTFSYDKRSMEEGRTNGQITYDVAVMDMKSKNIEVLDVFHGAENLNPSFDHENNIYFVSEGEGFRNLYRYISNSGQVFRMTDILTGISGISRYSPSITVSKKRDKVLYTHYFKNGYSIYDVTTKQMINELVDASTIDLRAGTLPIINDEVIDVVNENLRTSDDYVLVDTTSFNIVAYRPKFKLDYIGGGTGVGVGNNSFGTSTGVQGGIDLLFGDMLGNNQLFGRASVSGDILDAGGQFSYLNRKSRLAWGVGLSHIPLRTGYQEYVQDRITYAGQENVQVLNNRINLIRVFDEGVNVFAHFPFSTTMRLEGGIRGSYRSFRHDVYNDYYLDRGFNNYFYIGQDRQKIPVPDRIDLNQYYSLVKGFGASVNLALVGDNSFFGLTSPLAGYRYRFGVDKFVGSDDYFSVTADYRRYFWKKPFSLALRFTGNARFETKTNSVFPYYVGQMGFVRGYGSAFSYGIVNDLGLDFSQLLGSKIGVTSAEIRIPFTGPKQLALIGSKTVLTDLVFFADGGVAFNDFKQIKNGYAATVYQRDSNGNIITDANGNPLTEVGTIKPTIARSVGAGIRVNLFGYMILEPYFARQLQSNGRVTFGLNFIPGW